MQILTFMHGSGERERNGAQRGQIPFETILQMCSMVKKKTLLMLPIPLLISIACKILVLLIIKNLCIINHRVRTLTIGYRVPILNFSS